MKKVQAEPGADAKPCWVGTGHTVFDNKGNPVKKYEPYFSPTPVYEDEPAIVMQGVTPILRYDPLSRLVRTDFPNGTFATVAFDAWSETHADANDNVLESAWYASRQGLPSGDPERRAADLAAAHAHTPTLRTVDPLGRAILVVADNGPAGKYATRTALDIEGNPLVVTDARQNEAERSVFGMGGRKLWQKSCDAGERRMLADVGGAVIRAWDARGFTRRMVYDRLRRATHLYVQKDAAPEILAERRVYGEALPDAAVRNLRGKAHQIYGSEGVVTSELHDFKGNPLKSQRRLAVEYHAQVDWSVIGGLTDGAAIKAGAEPLLEAEVFAEQTAYDALNRPVSLTAPDASEIRPTYNEASLLEKVDVRIRGAAAWTTFVDDLDYDAKGQREKIVFGNGTRTTYAYDPLTFRLARLKTVRDGDGVVLQNLSYTHDPIGNITETKDSAQQTVFFNNDVVSPSMQYVYDALYRLIQATGREHAGGIGDGQRDQNDLPLMNLPHVNDAQALRNYVESYGYDAVGNILKMLHQAGAGSWTRRYAYEAGSNRLSSTSLPGDPEGEPYSATYGHDAHGNMTSMPHLASIGWDFKDQMRIVDLGGGGTAYCIHDATGQRVRKVIERIGTLIEERIYLGGYEVYRKRDHTGVLLERETLHVMDDQQRIALVETKTVDTAAGPFTVTPRVCYQLGNDLGSAVMEVDEGGLVISYEEYHPYGTTAYRSARSGVEVSEKRYRYTGKERDEETGLYYHGARCYAPWLGRWTSADPAGMVDGPNLYQYARVNPIVHTDPTGHQTKRSKLPQSSSNLRQAPGQARQPRQGTPSGYKATKEYRNDLLPPLPPKPTVPLELLNVVEGESASKITIDPSVLGNLNADQGAFIFKYFLYAADELAKRGLPAQNALLLVAHAGVETSYGKAPTPAHLNPNVPHNNFLSFQPLPRYQELLVKWGIPVPTEKRINVPGGKPQDTPVPDYASMRESLTAQIEIAYTIGHKRRLDPYVSLGNELANPDATAERYGTLADLAKYSGTPYNDTAQALPKEFDKSKNVVTWALEHLPPGLSKETQTWAASMLAEINKKPPPKP